MYNYIYNLSTWPDFTWDFEAIGKLLSSVRNKQGKLTGKLEAIGFGQQQEAYLNTLSQDIITSSEIEGEILNTAQVRSSIARKLGIDIGGLVDSDRDIDGIVEMMIDATKNWSQDLTEDRLFGWHATLFPNGRSGMYKIAVGKWRNDVKGPMQVVSGPMGKETVHFEAPAAIAVEKEMKIFLDWINKVKSNDPIIDASIAHLWFITIHPFEDGNGRLARAITDMMLSRSERNARRFYSLSSQIKKERKAYYEILEQSQKGTTDITDWLYWFLNCLDKAIDNSAISVQKIMDKHKFWLVHRNTSLNVRQRKIIDLLLTDFFGHLTSSKWAKLNKCSQDTALRDIQSLVKIGILKKLASGGRSTSYELILNQS